MRRPSLIAALVLLLAAIFVAPLVPDPFRLNLLGKYLCFALVALGLDLLWGYAGQLSLGHSVFFGLGACLSGHDQRAERCARPVPGAGADGRSTGWRIVWWPTAATGYRPRADRTSATPAARRANRRDPAVDRAGDSPRVASHPRSNFGFD